MDFQMPMVPWLKLFGVEIGDYILFKETFEVKRLSMKGLVLLRKFPSLEKAKDFCKGKTFHLVNDEGQFE